WRGAATQTGIATTGHHANTVLITQAQPCGDLFCSVSPQHRLRPALGHVPPVGKPGLDCSGVSDDRFRAKRVKQLAGKTLFTHKANSDVRRRPETGGSRIEIVSPRARNAAPPVHTHISVANAWMFRPS